MASFAARSAIAGPPTKLPAQLARGRVDVVGRHHLVDQADAQRLVGVDEPAR